MKKTKFFSLMLAIAVLFTSLGLTNIGNTLISAATDSTTDDFIDIDSSSENYAFSFAAVGDTQKLLWYDLENGTTKFADMYDWIVENAEAKKIKCVMGLGDITDTNNNDNTNEWNYAKANIDKLKDADIPFTIVRGNHDKRYSETNFNDFFPYSEYKDTISGSFDQTMHNTYLKLEIGQTKYLIMNLDCGISSYETTADDVFDWANSVVEAHPDHKVIVTTHIYLQSNGSTSATPTHSPDAYGLYGGDDIWEKFVRKHENIFLVLSGHVTAENIARSQAIGDHGNLITQLMINPQGLDLPEQLNGTGMVALLNFSHDGETVDVEYYSTVYGKHFREVNQFSFNTTKGNVVYVSSNGTGDGSSPESPLGNAEGYIPANTEHVNGNAFIRALSAVRDTGGTIVVVGPTSIDTCNYYAGESGKTAAETTYPSGILDADYTKRPTVTITSVYNGIDYRTAENGGAKLIFDHSVSCSANLQMRNPSIWKDLHIEYRYNPDWTSYYNSTSSGMIAPFMIQCNYTKTVFDTGIVCTSYNTKTDSEGDVYPMIVGGHRQTSREMNTDLTIRSGKWYAAFAGGHGHNTSNTATVNGNASLNIEGGYVENVYGTGSVSRPYGTVTGTVNINVTGGEIENVYLTNGVEYTGSGVVFTASSDACITGTVYESPTENEDLINVTVTNNASTISPAESFSYTLDSNYYATITGYIGSSTTVNIPSTLNGYPVVSIGANAFKDHADLINITIPDTVTSIGNYAFYGCQNLKTLTNSSSVKTIGNYAFYDCRLVTKINIPYTVTSIGEHGFDRCMSLKSIHIPASVTSIGSNAFSDVRYCNSLTVDEANTVYHSDGNCLIVTATKTLIAGCNTSVIPFDGSVEVIGEYAFYNRKNLTSINIPDAVTTINRYAFYGSGLTTVWYEGSSQSAISFVGNGHIETDAATVTWNYDCCMGNNDNHTHVYDGICDAECNMCGLTREAPEHVYTDRYDPSCNVCSKNRDIVLYVSSNGTGDGSTPNSPLGNGTGYVPNDNTCYQENAFVKALYQLQPQGGIIVLVGPVSLDTVSSANLEAGKTAAELDVPSNGTSTSDPDYNVRPTITITSVYGGTDYRTAENGSAKLILDHSVCCSGNLRMKSPSIWKDLNIEYRYNPDYTSYYNNTSAGIIAPYMIQCDHTRTVFDTGIVCTSFNTKTQSEGNVYPAIIGGHRTATRTGHDTDVTVKSGTWAFVSAAGHGHYASTSGTVDGNANLTITGGTIGDVYGTGSIHRPYGTVNGSVNITITGGNIGNVYPTNGVAYTGTGITLDLPRNLVITDYTNDFTYTLSNDKATIVEYTGNATELVIPSETDSGYPVTAIGINAYKDLTTVTSITIPNTVTSIGDYAFYGCLNLRSLTLGNSVTSIGAYAFYDCRLVTSITIPETVITIGEQAFDRCMSLSSIHIPSAVISIGAKAFADVRYCNSITVDEANTVYHSENNCLIKTSTKTLIAGCNTSIIPFDGSVEIIEEYAFYNRKNLTSINIPSSVTTVKRYSFYGSGLTTVLYEGDSQANITLVGNGHEKLTGATWQYNYCMGNTETHEHTYNNDLDAQCNFCLTVRELSFGNYFEYTVSSEKVTITKYTGTITAVTVPEAIEGYTVTVIGENAFKDRTDIKSIVLPDTITSIGNYAFYDCRLATSINIPDTVTSIGERAFDRCMSLKSIHIPASVTSIGTNAFSDVRYCNSLTVDEANTVYHSDGNCLIVTATKTLIAGCNTSVIPFDGSVEVIGEYAFYNRKNLTSINIPDAVTTINRYAFYGSGLTTVWYEGSSQSAISFVGNGHIETDAATVTWNYNCCMGNNDNHTHVYDGDTDNECNLCNTVR